MQAREKKLALILGGAIAVWFVLPVFEGWFLQPVTQREGLLAVAQSQLDDREAQLEELHIARARLRDWRYESLPPNPLTAQREYQEWLMKLAAMSGFQNPVATLGRRTPRGATYVQVPVTIEADVTLEQLSRFLYHCQRVALLHRIDSVDITSPQSDGNPLLKVTLTAIGLSLPNAEERRYLFPRTALTAELTQEETTIEVQPPKRFPQVTGFQVRLGQELATVAQLDGATWTLQRGAEQTVAGTYPAETVVELFPVDLEHTATFEQYASLIEHGPFTKPAPLIDYQPKFAPLSETLILRGRPWEAKLSVTGWDPAGGSPQFNFSDEPPSGLQLDDESGQLTWTPPDDVVSQEYEVRVRAESRIKPEQKVETTLTLTLRDPNLAPVFEEIEQVTAYSGRPFTLSVYANDPDGAGEEMTYELAGDVPEGVQIDETTGDLSWTPPLTLDLGEYPVEITATDAGEPAQSASTAVTINVVEDSALHTYYVGYFDEDGQPEAFLYNRATNERTIAHPGEQIVVADIEAQIARIDREHLELTIGSRTFRLPLGKSLRQLLPVSQGVSAGDSEGE